VEPVALIFADEVEPRDFLELVGSLGGEVHPEDGIEARLSRGRRHVWVITADSGALEPIDPEEAPEYEERLGAPPRSKVVLDMSDEPGADRLAFEIVDAAAARWRLVVDDNVEFVRTVDELRERVAAHRPMVFVDPGRRLALYVAEAVEPADVVRLVESAGGQAHPDGWTDARLARGRDQVWVSTGESPTPAEASAVEAVLGARPGATVGLYLTESPGAERLAVPLVTAAAARWSVVVGNGQDVRTVDEVRARVAADEPTVFWDAPTDDQGDDDR